MNKIVAVVITTAIVVTLPLSVAGASNPSTATLRHEAGVQVLRIINTENGAIQKAKARTDFAAASKDFSTAATELRAVKYPKLARADAKALEGILGTLSYDAGQVAIYATREKDGTLSAIAVLEGLMSTVQGNEGTELADSDALRADLGLPPAKAPS